MYAGDLEAAVADLRMRMINDDNNEDEDDDT